MTYRLAINGFGRIGRNVLRALYESSKFHDIKIVAINGCLLLTRQNIQKQARDAEQESNIKKGGYVLFEGGEKIDAIILATGSEVEIAIAAAKKLQEQGSFVRVVSMPCVEIFKQQDAQYRGWVLPSDVKKRVAIEAGAPDSWYQFVGLDGKVFGIERFGLSAPYQEIYQEFGLTVEKVVAWLKK